MNTTDPNSGEGWYAWQHMPANTSHIAYVYENGEVYLPESPGDTDEPFLLAAAAGHIHRLVRADEVRPRGTVTDAEVEAAARAMFEDPTVTGDGYTWDEMVKEDPSRADIWRTDARRVLDAARGVRS